MGRRLECALCLRTILLWTGVPTTERHEHLPMFRCPGLGRVSPDHLNPNPNSNPYQARGLLKELALDERVPADDRAQLATLLKDEWWS